VQALASRHQTVAGTPELDILGVPEDPAQVGSIATRQTLPARDHRRRAIDRIDGLDHGGEWSSNIAGAAPKIQHDARLTNDQVAQPREHGRDVRWPMVVHRHDGRIGELAAVLEREAAGLGNHLRHSRDNLGTVQVIRAGRLIDGTGAAVQRDRALYVEDGQIVGVEAAGDAPADAELVDLSALTVLPGLIDAHVHLVFSRSAHALADLLVEDDQQLLLRGVAAAREALRAGITTVRDLGGRGGVTFRLRDAIARELIAGPRILAAGSPITITGGHCHFLGLEADDEAAVRAAARRQLKAGANCLKIMATGGRMTPGTNIRVAQYSVAELRAAVDEAQRAHVPLAAHALGTAGIRNATLAGVTTIEHCNWLGPDGTVEFDEAVAVRMAEQGTAVVPTLTPLKRSASALREQVTDCMRRMARLGVPIVAGTDAGVSSMPFDSLPDELEIYVSDVGLTPVQAIQVATGTAARILGLEQALGTLVPGRAADLVAVDGDPSVRIDDVRSARLVLKGGRTVVRDGVVL